MESLNKQLETVNELEQQKKLTENQVAMLRNYLQENSVELQSLREQLVERDQLIQ